MTLVDDLTIPDTQPASGFDPFVPGFRDDLYSHYRHWRETDTVHWGPAPDQSGRGCWYVFSHAEARAVLSDRQFAVDPTTVIPPEYLPVPPDEHLPLLEMLGRWFIFRDPPEHTRLRQSVAKAFERAALDALEPEIRQIAQDLCAKMAGKDSADLIADLALALPVRVIARILGLPESDLGLLNQWSVALLAGLDFTTAERQFASRVAGSEAAVAFSAYLGEHIDRATVRGGDGLLAVLAAGTRFDRAAREEAIANAALLVFAGHETTVNLIGNGFEALMRHPDQYDQLARSPELRGAAIEEFARFNSPSQVTFRFASEPCELLGRKIEPGSPIGVVIGSANRDGLVFDTPDQFDVARAPNPHLSYGKGIHACLGAALARREARAALDAFLAVFPDARSADGPRDWAGSIGLRGLKTLEFDTGP